MTYVIHSDFCTRYHASKPTLPYLIGSRYSLISHRPSAPERSNDGYIPFSEDARELRIHQHPVEGCRINSPDPGISIDKPHQIQAQIIDAIRVRDAASAQIVVIEILSMSGCCSSTRSLEVGSRCIAKFYDPLYNHYQDDNDPFLVADYSYQHEVTAYEQLSDLQGSMIPSFYGSYTTNIQTPFTKTMLGHAKEISSVMCQGPCERAVRCILIEKIEGTALQHLPYDISDGMSQAIMKGIIDAESQIYKRNVRHEDLYARNVIVSGLDNERPKVIIIDFGGATTGYRGSSDDSREDDERRMPGVYISPLLRWHASRFPGDAAPADFEPWIRWDWQTWLDYTYEHEVKLITPEMKNVFLSDRWLKRVGMQWKFDV